jgi:NAD(P)-dependent dehydrogenase (short-subunit alcohol dehydrogenase family)
VTPSPEVLHARPLSGIEDIEPALLDAFLRAREAVVGGRSVVAVVRDGDLLGHGEAADAAFANALVGLVRALATEGAREGWTVNALAVPDEMRADQRDAWIARLARGEGAGGALLRLGDLQLGRVPL